MVTVLTIIKVVVVIMMVGLSSSSVVVVLVVFNGPRDGFGGGPHCVVLGDHATRSILQGEW